MLDRLQQYRDHPALKAIRRAAAENPGFNDTVRGRILARVSDPPELAEIIRLPDFSSDQAGSRENRDAWLQALRTFAKDTEFMRIFAEERKPLEPALRAYQTGLDEKGFVRRIERYAGLSFDGRYLLIVEPFHPRGIEVNDVADLPDGTYQIASIISPPPLESAAPDSERLRPEIWHELSHGLIDIMMDLDWDRIQESRSLYPGMGWPCYGDWDQCVKEHLVRAVMLRLLAQDSPEAEAAQLVKEEPRFPYLKELARLLETDYEGHRDRYPTLARFYPRMLAVFAQRAALHDRGATPPDVWSEQPTWFGALTCNQQTPGREKRAVRYLGLMAGASSDPDMLLRRAAFRLLADDYPGAESDAHASLRDHGSEPAAHLVEGLALSALGRLAEAGKEAQSLRALCAHQSSGTAGPVCMDFKKLEGRLSRWEPFSAAGFGGCPPQADASSRVVEQVAKLFAAGQLPAALAAVEKGLAVSPRSVELHADRGVLLQKLKRFADAQKSYSQAIVLAEADHGPQAGSMLADLLSSRASLWSEAGRPEDARIDLERALRSAPSDWPRRGEIEQLLKASR